MHLSVTLSTCQSRTENEGNGVERILQYSNDKNVLYVVFTLRSFEAPYTRVACYKNATISQKFQGEKNLIGRCSVYLGIISKLKKKMNAVIERISDIVYNSSKVGIRNKVYNLWVVQQMAAI